SSLHLDRVLSGQHIERTRQIVTDTLDGDAAFLHGFKQCCLSLRRRAVDLVGEHDVREDWTANKLQRAPSGHAVFLDNLSSSDVRRHQVWCELNPLERQIEHTGDGANEQSFCQAWHSSDD